MSTPSSRQYSVASADAEGFAKMAELLSADVLVDLEGLTGVPADRSVLIAARSSRLGDRELRLLADFVSRGGTLVAYGGNEYVESLARGLGITVTTGGHVYDAVFNAGSRELVRVELNGSTCALSVYLRAPRAIQLAGTRGNASPIAFTSPLSYVDRSGNGFYDVGEFVGSSLVGLEVPVGRGVAVVLFADGFLENHLVEHNREFANCVSSGRLVLVDNSEFSGDLAELLKLAVRSTQTRTYVLASLLLLAAVSYYVLKE
ncbi:MAG: hypothetical protein RMI56_04470 [Sulfolobales archaeon]|nr:hypothetical protein [Sulfolobales archaeon]